MTAAVLIADARQYQMSLARRRAKRPNRRRHRRRQRLSLGPCTGAWPVVRASLSAVHVAVADAWLRHGSNLLNRLDALGARKKTNTRAARAINQLDSESALPPGSVLSLFFPPLAWCAARRATNTAEHRIDKTIFWFCALARECQSRLLCAPKANKGRARSFLSRNHAAA